MYPHLVAAISIALVLSSIGCQGPLGPDGPRGSIGEAGVGAQGDKGAPGPEGPQGPQGPQGPEGPEGADGQRGSTGETGAPGLQGPIGATGPVGSQGWSGPTGAPGMQGEEGDRGRRGFQGAAGENTIAIAVNTSNDVFNTRQSGCGGSLCAENPNLLWGDVRHLAVDWAYTSASDWTEIQSVTITVPSAGWVIVEAVGAAEATISRGAVNRSFTGAVGVSDSESGDTKPDYAEHLLGAERLSPATFDVSHAYCFTDPGARTYRVLAIGYLVSFTPHMLTVIHYPGTC
jgi:hypothetical protein